jgi:ketosteroid isomerase-like protein
MIRHCIVIALTLSIATPSAIAQDNSDIDQIRAARADYNDAIARHDVPAIVSFLDEEYQVTTSLGQLLQDRDGEAAAWRDLIKSREDLLYVRSPESIEVSSEYPLAAELGTWVGTWSTNQGEVRTGGRYAAMWRQVDGVWKVRSELFVALYCTGASCP